MGRLRHRCTAAALAATVTLLLGVAGAAPAAATAPPEAAVHGAGAPGSIPGSYLVILKPAAVKASRERGAALAGKFGGTLRQTYTAALDGYAIELTERAARQLAADPAVAEVVQNRRVRADTTRTNPPSWGLDRIDQRRPPLDFRYTYQNGGGAGVTAYIIDTGVLISHQEFGGRASYGYDAIDGDTEADDGYGHGTHVAATVAGASFGVADKARIVSVRVLDDAGYGTTEQVVAGIDWVTRNAHRPAVANLSLGGDPDDALDTAVRNSIASGITYVAAAGNDGADASGHSPARVPTAITVGATDRTDTRADFSNYGPLVDLFAPGVNIPSAYFWDDQDTATLSGTSMAAPHVTGAVALYLADHPTATPAQVSAALVADATGGVVTDPGTGTPNRLLHSGAAPAVPPGPRFENTTDLPVPDEATVESPITVTGVPGRAPAALEVEVDIKHPWIGNLRVELRASSGRSYLLRDFDEDDWSTDLGRVFTVNASAETATGRWRLRVTDETLGATGYLDRWALQF
ncbi:S8 family serine peptidase [Kitasatospora sp. NPDC094015]|uniref:S8 family serine peptidase n=1 Tax=Kitasatospora sp. NPDC094015 TaxID=3155205 RepID=UPI00332DC282